MPEHVRQITTNSHKDCVNMEFRSFPIPQLTSEPSRVNSCSSFTSLDMRQPSLFLNHFPEILVAIKSHPSSHDIVKEKKPRSEVYRSLGSQSLRSSCVFRVLLQMPVNQLSPNFQHYQISNARALHIRDFYSLGDLVAFWPSLTADRIKSLAFSTPSLVPTTSMASPLAWSRGTVILQPLCLRIWLTLAPPWPIT